MNAILVLIDCLAFLVLSWTAFAVLHESHEVVRWRDASLVTCLVGLKIGAFCAALAVVATGAPLSWWARGVVVGSALLAAGYYDHRFGIKRHAAMLIASLSAYIHRRPQ